MNLKTGKTILLNVVQNTLMVLMIFAIEACMFAMFILFC